MPVLDGFGAARALTAAAKGQGRWLPPICALSANVAQEVSPSRSVVMRRRPYVSMRSETS